MSLITMFLTTHFLGFQIDIPTENQIYIWSILELTTWNIQFVITLFRYIDPTVLGSSHLVNLVQWRSGAWSMKWAGEKNLTRKQLPLKPTRRNKSINFYLSIEMVQPMEISIL